MKLERYPLGNPTVECLPGDQKYPFKLTSDFVYLWPGDKDFSRMDVVVPKGYCTDFFSINWFLRSLVNPLGSGIHGAICHDLICSIEYGLPYENIDRRVLRANRIIRQCMLDSGASSFRAWLIYLGVSIGCKWTWRDHIRSEVLHNQEMTEEATARWNKRDAIKFEQ